MATFVLQVEALTGIAIDGSSSPTETELTQFLNDGVMDVTNRWLVGHPQDADKFMRVSGEVTSNASEKVARATIISVVREDGTNNQWRECIKIPVYQQYEVTDEESLNFASKINPVYMVAEDGAISVFPVPGSDPDAFKVYYVNNNPRGDDDNSVTYSSTGLAFFPNDKVYVVVLYAAIKAISNQMAKIRSDLSSFSITAVPPDMPTTGIGLPTYEVSTTSVGSGNIDAEIGVMLSYIETSEDIELASAKASEIQLRLKRALDKFNADVTEYKIENDSEIAHYGVEINAYSADVNAQVSEQAQKIATETSKYQWLTERYGSYTQQYYSIFVIPSSGEAS